jgi:hypothetical protein
MKNTDHAESAAEIRCRAELWSSLNHHTTNHSLPARHIEAYSDVVLPWEE